MAFDPFDERLYILQEKTTADINAIFQQESLSLQIMSLENILQNLKSDLNITRSGTGRSSFKNNIDLMKSQISKIENILQQADLLY